MRYVVGLCALGLGMVSVGAWASSAGAIKPAAPQEKTEVQATPVQSKENAAAYKELLAQFDELSRQQSPLAYATLVSKPLMSQSGDAMFKHYQALLQPHIAEEPKAALLYAALLATQARKPMLQLPGEGMTPQREAMWLQLPSNPLFQEANRLLVQLCEKQNLQACMAHFYELFDAGTPVMMGHDRKEQDAFVRVLIEAENEVRRIAIMNYAKQPTPGLAGFVASLYTRGLSPFPAEQAKGMGFVRDADKAARWQEQAGL